MRQGSCFNIRSQACESRKRRPPFLLSDGFLTHSQIASFTPLSNHFSSLSRMIMSSLLNWWPECLEWVKTEESWFSLELPLWCWLKRAFLDCLVCPTYNSSQPASEHLSPWTTLLVLWSTQRLSTFMSTQRISRHVDIIFYISTKEQWKNKMSIITHEAASLGPKRHINKLRALMNRY